MHHGQDELGTPVPGVQAEGTNLWRVQVGGMDTNAGIDFQGFFPGEITINAGDTIWFDGGQMPGFHAVTFLGSQTLPDLLIPDPDAGTPVVDAPPTLMVNPVLAYPSGGTTFDGTSTVNSGLDVLRADVGPFVVRLTKPGSFDYFCVPHQAVMRAKVTVQEAGSELPYQQADYDALAAEQTAQLVEEGKAEIAKYAMANEGEPGSGVDWVFAAGAGEDQARIKKFLPEIVTIKKGQTIRWINRSLGEPHTVTYLSGEDAHGGDFNIVTVENGPPMLIANPEVFFQVGGNVYSGKG
jgi:plastocyanin